MKKRYIGSENVVKVRKWQAILILVIVAIESNDEEVTNEILEFVCINDKTEYTAQLNLF